MLSFSRFRRPGRLAAALLAAGLVAGAGCADQEFQQRQAEGTDDGVQITGRVGGAQLSVSYGDPDFTTTDCDVDDGFDVDWCLTARSIDGARVVLVLENPRALVVGAELDVRLDRCTGCDDVEGMAVVDLRVDGISRRAIGGVVRISQAGPERYAATFSLRFDDGGQINGEFNVRPLFVLTPAESASDASPSPAASPGS